METKHTNIHQTSQDLKGEQVVERNGRIVRARIRRNSYDKQSFGIAEVLTEGGWADLVNVPITDLEIAHFSYVTRDLEWEGTMELDLEHLLNIAIDIVDGWTV